ncbi:Nuclear transport factor 2 [Saxophila tyrrhenica]|uniref:Nuclear transport factor 2 n=1 Tax=Saxophila tyrrhenica TaxID=1690608 RepID=A0AAV9PAK6_9PEZI|nr:Nuclear transport factor 2 [Saxophila tyrrhenica]
MADFESIAKQFVEYYYKTFDENRNNLAPLYRDESMLTFEATPCQGTSAIVSKLSELPFQRIEHQVATIDAQPSNTTGGIIVVVSGALLVEEERRPMSYTQTFQLMPNDQGSYFVFNDVFRLVYPAA